MGIFDSFIKTIGSGLSKVGASIGSGLSKVYTSVVKPVYNKVIRPVGEASLRIFDKGLSTGERFISGGMDSTEKLIEKGRGTALNVADAGLNLSSLLKNPIVLIGAFVGGLIVVSKI